MAFVSKEARANEAKLIDSAKHLLDELRAIRVQNSEAQDALEKSGTVTLVEGVELLVTQLAHPTTRASLQKDWLTVGLRQELTARVYGLAEALSQVKDLELRLHSIGTDLKILVNSSDSSKDLCNEYLASLTKYSTASRYVRALQSVMQGKSLLGIPNWPWSGVYKFHDDLEGVELIKPFGTGVTWKERELELCHSFHGSSRESSRLVRSDSIPGSLNFTDHHTAPQTRLSTDSVRSAEFGSVSQ
ncbi:hypothetical protein NliqN6_4492 [Naganishia liquefaciens]|uniref:Uncharacterized protein n=1 Tax=Naganishia liquefaciens TaxID=104408 RepID=A0A8H3YFU2_9TREE|nr:hypothetical protein NliqN6_4492 [Naganishia liquefaciens]